MVFSCADADADCLGDLLVGCTTTDMFDDLSLATRQPWGFACLRTRSLPHESEDLSDVVTGGTHRDPELFADFHRRVTTGDQLRDSLFLLSQGRQPPAHPDQYTDR